ncbi:hypothetical protein ABEF95_006677 [Exophiala dermatitidis]
MQLTASTVATILAFTVAQVGALPSPQQPTTSSDSVAVPTTSAAPAPPPPAESGGVPPVYYPEEEVYPEEEAYYVVEKRWTPSNHPSGQQTGPPGNGNSNGKIHTWPGAGAAGGGRPPHPYQGAGQGQHYGGPGLGHAHGPMASESDEYDDYDYDYEDDQQAAHLSRRGVDVDNEEDGEYEDEDVPHKRLDRRFGFKIKQFKWWQHQTTKPLDFVVGNPNIRNLNFKDGARTTPLGVGMRRRRDVAPGAPVAGQEGHDQGQEHPTTPDAADHGIAQDEDGNYYYYYYPEEDQEQEAKD